VLSWEARSLRGYDDRWTERSSKLLDVGFRLDNDDSVERRDGDGERAEAE
jgi:hypothetical protein